MRRNLDARSDMRRESLAIEPPFVIADAGGEGLGPSNTIETTARSLIAGADILDVDLCMTSVGVIVALHVGTWRPPRTAPVSSTR